MTTTENTATATANLLALVQNVCETRKFGHTYVKAAVRKEVTGYDGITARIGDREVKITFEGYGRSLAYGGHKYKANARFSDTGKPVPSKDIRNIQAA